jgi:hypothetical protein
VSLNAWSPEPSDKDFALRYSLVDPLRNHSYSATNTSADFTTFNVISERSASSTPTSDTDKAANAPQLSSAPVADNAASAPQLPTLPVADNAANAPQLPSALGHWPANESSARDLGSLGCLEV